MAGQGGGEANRQWFGRKGTVSPCGPNVGHDQQCALAAKAASSTLSWGSMKQRQHAGRYESVSGALCLLLDSTVHQQTGLSPEEATEVVRGLAENWVCSAWRRESFRKEGHKRADGEQSPQWYTVVGSRPAGTGEIQISQWENLVHQQGKGRSSLGSLN